MFAGTCGLNNSYLLFLYASTIFTFKKTIIPEERKQQLDCRDYDMDRV